ncbi:ABC transporter substrate-binding protein [Sphingorhabdus arenilitoris]|uniref:ABC transporter substrate-binding protein n=1 Tax=Sphingorhabdus arenilitoris TaxID=1490041 RepID=A0ABV8RK33_9SPHN
MRWVWPLFLALAGCSGQTEIAPGGIVSNNPCIDAVLSEIAAPGQVAAVSIYSHDPASASAPVQWARQYPALGISAEEVIAARPRLLLTGNLASSGTNAALAKAAIRHEAFGVPANVPENLEQVKAVGKAIGRMQAAEHLMQRIMSATTPAPATGRRAIIWQTGGFVPGKGTLQDELLSRAGFTNASATYGLSQWSQLPLEPLVRNPPDVIFMPVTGDGEAGRELAMRRKLLRYFPETKIVTFPDRLLFCGGPTIIEAMKVMRAA